MPHVARELGKTSRETRKARSRTLLALLILTVVAIGAVVAGIVANNNAFWTGASIVFYMALAALITYAANELGIVSKTADLLRAALNVSEGSPEQSKPTKASKASGVADAALVLATRFEEAGQLTEAENAYVMAAEENGDKRALYWLGLTCIDRGDYKEAELWLLKAAGRGQLGAYYQLGWLHRVHGQKIPDEIYEEMLHRGVSIAAYLIGHSDAYEDDYLSDYAFPEIGQLSLGDLRRYVIEPSGVEANGEPHDSTNASLMSEILKNLTGALPEYAEFWQAYLVELLDDNDVDGAILAIDEAIEGQPNNYGLRLLRVRLDSSHADQIDVSTVPEPMRAEISFHKAISIIRKDGYDYLVNRFLGRVHDLDDQLKLVISEAEHYQSEPPWRSQLLAIKAIREYISGRYRNAGKLLKESLTLESNLTGDLSSDDVGSLALTLEFWGNNAVRPLASALLRARPKIQNALNGRSDDVRISKALLSSMVPGIDMRVPIPGSPQFSATELLEVLDSSGLHRKARDQKVTGEAETNSPDEFGQA